MAGSPKLWSKFSVKTKDGKVINLRIVDLPKSLNDKFVELYMKYYATGERTYIAAGVPKSAEAMAELRERVLRTLKKEAYHVVICHIDYGDGQIKDIVGASMMLLTSKNDPDPWTEFEIKTKEVKKVTEILQGLENHYDERIVFDLDLCFIDKGAFVLPEYRGLGIAEEFLRVRRVMCKEKGIPINGTWMTAYGSQKAAERDGWMTLSEIHCDELGKKYGVTFDNDAPTYKFMLAKL